MYGNKYVDAPDEENNLKMVNLINCNLKTVSPTLINIYAEGCEYLDLSFNRLQDLRWLYEFKSLKYLILDNNPLTEIHLQRLKHPLETVKVLMLNKNEFFDLKSTITEVARLFPKLEYLSLHGNSICPDYLELKPFSEYISYDYKQYREFILRAMPNLKFLDHSSVRQPYEYKESLEIGKWTIQSLWGAITTMIRNFRNESIEEYSADASGSSNQNLVLYSSIPESVQLLTPK